jgi:hypothetical protein
MVIPVSTDATITCMLMVRGAEVVWHVTTHARLYDGHGLPVAPALTGCQAIRAPVCGPARPLHCCPGMWMPPIELMLLDCPAMTRPTDRAQPRLPCPYCREFLIERASSEVTGRVPADPTLRVILLKCSNGHEFAWREGLPNLLPRRG